MNETMRKLKEFQLKVCNNLAENEQEEFLALTNEINKYMIMLNDLINY